jgi:hypothetical protein
MNEKTTFIPVELLNNTAKVLFLKNPGHVKQSGRVAGLLPWYGSHVPSSVWEYPEYDSLLPSPLSEHARRVNKSSASILGWSSSAWQLARPVWELSWYGSGCSPHVTGLSRRVTGTGDMHVNMMDMYGKTKSMQKNTKGMYEHIAAMYRDTNGNHKNMTGMQVNPKSMYAKINNMYVNKNSIHGNWVSVYGKPKGMYRDRRIRPPPFWGKTKKPGNA